MSFQCFVEVGESGFGAQRVRSKRVEVLLAKRLFLVFRSTSGNIHGDCVPDLLQEHIASHYPWADTVIDSDGGVALTH